MVFLNRSIFRTTGNPTTTCRFFWARIEIETDRNLSDDLPTAASGALMARCQETRSSTRNSGKYPPAEPGALGIGPLEAATLNPKLCLLVRRTKYALSIYPRPFIQFLATPENR